MIHIIRNKNKCHLIISTYWDKGHRSTYFLDESCEQNRSKGLYLQIIKIMHNRHSVNYTLSEGYLIKAFPLTPEMRQECPWSLPLFSIVFQNFPWQLSNRKIKGMQKVQEKTQLSLFADNMSLNSEYASKRFFHLTSSQSIGLEFNKCRTSGSWRQCYIVVCNMEGKVCACLHLRISTLTSNCWVYLFEWTAAYLKTSLWLLKQLTVSLCRWCRPGLHWENEITPR